MIIIDSASSVNGHELRAESRRVSAGPRTVAARNHGGGGPSTFTTHGELVQVRVSRGRPYWLSHMAAARSTPLVDLADRHESDARAQRRSVRR